MNEIELYNLIVKILNIITLIFSLGVLYVLWKLTPQMLNLFGKLGEIMKEK